ncbi:tetratricopeptide repeat protein [Vibrio cholerae]|nr:tetratricopeptide repeat protein [Vibrio cholerae]EGR0538781.1 tetratricopeptide repeat protein [Vibrio cholerae]EGR2311439.1 tetratricopeptide repeat protein [Vibrio cholerae]EGR3954457.1 tetratricopeptide repeat protein [Vibrio cholerae]EGR3989231.1 tetratricopeptide repeat protein [Vibrio cholerae]
MMSAVNRLKEYFKFDPENAALALELIEALAAQGDFQEALMVLGEAKKYHENDPMFISWTGHLGLATRDFNLAVEAYDNLFKRGFDQSGLLVNSALAHYQLGQFHKAKSLLDNVSDLDVTNRVLKARCYAQLEEISSAITDVQVLVKECTMEQMPEVLGLLALLYLDDAQYDLAQEYCQKTLSVDESQFDARIVAASLALYKMHIDEAMALIEPLDSDYPDSGRILAMKALVLMYRQQFENAITTYERACKKMPNHLGSRINLGWCYFAVSELDKAEACFKEGIHIDRTFAESHGGMALIYAFKEMWPQSQECFKRGLKLDSFSPSSLFARALYFKNKSRSNEAEKIVAGLMEHKSDLSELNLKEVVSSIFSMKQ